MTMAAFDSDPPPTSQIGEREPSVGNASSNSKHPDVGKIRKILSRHDPSGNVTSRIGNLLSEDGLTLDLLSDFDEISLEQTIQSWNISSFHKKPHIIRGLLLNAIKQIHRSKLATLNDSNNNNNATTTTTNVGHSQVVITQEELKNRQQLKEYEIDVLNEMK